MKSLHLTILGTEGSSVCCLSIDPRIELSLLGWISRVGGHNKDLVELLHTQKREDTLQ